jgi:hypothetical protein
MNIKHAAVSLAETIFGSARSYERRGGVRAENGFLNVYTWIALANWPTDRVQVWQGFPVEWHWVAPAAAKAEAEAHL